MNKRKAAIVISASSDIGAAACQAWLRRGWHVFGTYRTASSAVHQLRGAGAVLIQCDLSESQSVGDACESLREQCSGWDILVLAAGSQEPVGQFSDCVFDEWQKSICINFSAQMRIVHQLLPTRSRDTALEPCVLFFAGGGTNSATLNYSAYTVSKIAIIKMCELLDAEIPDARFVILGPGWVKTKIHESTLRARERAGANYQRALQELAGEGCVPIDTVVECMDWIIDAPRVVVSGRNISLVYDDWGNPRLAELLQQDQNMFKLRRSGNDRLVRSVPISERALRGNH